MAISRKKKEELVEEFADKLQESKSVVFTDYKGLTVSDISELRNSLRKKGIEFKVIKNTLFSLAVKKAKFDIKTDEFRYHPVALAFGYDDEMAPAREIYGYAKNNEFLEILGGMFEGKEIGIEEVKSLALMPSRDELLAKLVGTINAPVTNFVGVLNANLRNVVGVLSAIQEQKS